MNEEAIYEIGDIIHVRNTVDKRTLLRKLTPKEITESWEYKMFKKHHPTLCKLAEK